MANTTNFNWETPDDTDLVKDGAAAIRTLAGAIDTSLVDLKGGTSGQILAKATNTDMDFAWVANDVGDITEVVAGTGISGGGTSGSVTITNTVATEFDAKGDLVVGTGADTFDKLTVGANNTVLTADSSTATGLKWAAAAGGGGKVLQVIQGTATSDISNSTTTYADTTLSATITPSSASSKVLVFVTQNATKTAGDSQNAIYLRLMRNATQVVETNLYLYTNSTLLQIAGIPINYLDTPATTSAVTYKTQYKNFNASSAVVVQGNSAPSVMILMEIGA